jgi:ABC-type glycerol-3-phosphate transport system permease component
MVKISAAGRGRCRRVFHQALLVSAAAFSAVLILVPIVWMVSASLRPIKEILAYPPTLLPKTLTFQYFERILTSPQYQRYFMNSAILSLVTLALALVLGSLAAYGFSRYRIPGGGAMLMSILALLMLPQVTLIVPYFRLAHLAGLYDTLPGLIIVTAAFLLPMSTWLLKGYFDSLPIELEEAAMVDGCVRIQALWKIVLPLATPGLIGVGTFVFIGSWNEYLLPVVLTETPRAQTLTVGLAAFFGQYVRDWNGIMALSTLASLPLVVIFVLLQRWVVEGIGSGAIK